MFEFTKDVSGDLLILNIEDTSFYIAYQTALLLQNPHRGIIPFREQKSDHRIKLYYQLGKHLSLLQYLRNEQITPDKIMKVLDELVTIILESKNLLLYPAGFLLKPEYIFVEPQQGTAALIYVPLKRFSAAGQDNSWEPIMDVNENFRALLRSLFRYREDLPQTLFVLANEEDLQIKDFRARLKEIKFAVRKNERLTGPQEKPFQLVGFTEKVIPAPVISGAEKAPQSVIPPKKNKIRMMWSQFSGMKVFGLFVVLQLVLVILLVHFFPQINTGLEDPTNMLGVFLILIPLNVFFLRLLTRIK